MSTPSFHPELSRRARLLPKGLGRRWLRGPLRTAFRWAGRWISDGPEVELDGCSAFLYGWSESSGPRRPALLWIHGGGMIIGDARMDANHCLHLSRALGIPVVSAQYRLAPEHPFPTPLHDCKRVFDWLAEQPGIDPEQIVVAGQSAGGGLAASLCQLCASEGGPTPTFQALVYPMLDPRSAEGSSPTDAAFRLWDRPSNALGWKSYLRGHDPEAPPPFAVPARTTDLSNLPPAWIGVGDLDLFYEEDLAYARNLVKAGVSAETHVVPGAYHGFEAADPTTPVARAFVQSYVAAVAEHLRRSSE